MAQRRFQMRLGHSRLRLYDPFVLRFKDNLRFAAFCTKVGLPTTTAKAMRDAAKP